MRRIIKDRNSKILSENLEYIPNNSNNNSKISRELYKEQKGFCAYTEKHLGRTDAKDIEHFNPTLKGTNEDSYENWFLVKHQWNKEKSNKWAKQQPILHPTDPTFEKRIIYDDGDYRANEEQDLEAMNFIKLLNLDDLVLAEERKKYLSRKASEIETFETNAEDFFSLLIKEDITGINFLRAIDEEFEIDIWELLPKL